jgi:hypothetical protein
LGTEPPQGKGAAMSDALAVLITLSIGVAIGYAAYLLAGAM